jgi:hypothetical protein
MRIREGPSRPKTSCATALNCLIVGLPDLGDSIVGQSGAITAMFIIKKVAIASLHGRHLRGRLISIPVLCVIQLPGYPATLHSSDLVSAPYNSRGVPSVVRARN